MAAENEGQRGTRPAEECRFNEAAAHGRGKLAPWRAARAGSPSLQ